MRARLVSALGFTGLLVFSACVTINIYFPAKEVKAAVKSLEEELLKPGPEPSPPPKPKPEGRLREDWGPETGEWRLETFKGTFQMESSVSRLQSLVFHLPEAWAQGDLSKQINEELKKMPEVVEAYRRMGQRLREIDRLRNQGIVGEGRDGKLALRVDRSHVSPVDSSLIDQENQDREMVIMGMAKAVLRINKLEASGANLDRARPQAAELFASIRRDSAKPGWWIQLPDGTWQRR